MAYSSEPENKLIENLPKYGAHLDVQFETGACQIVILQLTCQLNIYETSLR